MNSSCYAFQRPERYAASYDATPPNFVFSIKGDRYITHILRSREFEKPSPIFLLRAYSNYGKSLREKLGPFLWQFPPSFRYAPEQLEHFLSLLPAIPNRHWRWRANESLK